VVRFDPDTEKFEVFPSDRSSANVRQLNGRPGEVWAPESGADRIVVYRTK
jgi:virginiamycin B lyase